MAAQTTHPPRVDSFQAWSFEKAMMEAQQHSPSNSSSSEFFDEKVRITPDLEAFKRSIQDQKSPAMFNERYLSSEEALSPLENDDSSTENVEEPEVIVLKSAVKFAVAVCILSVGKPKIVDVPVPSLTSSPSLQSTTSDKNSSNESFLIRPPTPVRSIRRKAIPLSKVSQRVAVRPRPSSELLASKPALDMIQTQIPQDATEIISSASTTPAFLTQDPFESKQSSRMGHSRFRNISQKFTRFALYSPGLPQKMETSPTSISKRSPTTLQKPSNAPPAQLRESIPSPQSPSPAPTTVKRKMIPRGAAERAPPIELPPFPDDEVEELTTFRSHKIRRRKSVLGF
jgi:hypothetical protein